MPPRQRSTKIKNIPSIIQPDPDTLPDGYISPDSYMEDEPVDHVDSDHVEPDQTPPAPSPYPNYVNPNFLRRGPLPMQRQPNSYPLNHRLIKRETQEWERTLPDGTKFQEKVKIRRGGGWLF